MPNARSPAAYVLFSSLRRPVVADDLARAALSAFVARTYHSVHSPVCQYLSAAAIESAYPATEEHAEHQWASSNPSPAL
ncbi:hypothetical protein B0H13DRAFT_2364567 [Mycena leptocephala]|nr:hypothetical protein B0H13DRAFT_2364567 [Mycena leptocephala]